VSSPPEEAVRIGRAMRQLAGAGPGALPDVRQMHELLAEALEQLGVDERGYSLSRRRTRWKALLRRALCMAAGTYRRLLCPMPPHGAELYGELEALGAAAACRGPLAPDLRSCVAVAEQMARTEAEGLRSILVLGPLAALGLALGRLTGQRIALAPEAEADRMALEAAGRKLGLDLVVYEPLEPAAELPVWLRGRFQAVVSSPPGDALGAHRELRAAAAALEPCAGRRLYWLGHPERQLDYFGLYSHLARDGYVLERLLPEAACRPMDAAPMRQLAEDVRQSGEAAATLEPGCLDDLLAGGSEPEHLHLFRPAAEVVIPGRELDLVPLQAPDVPLLDAWLTPQLSAAIGFDVERPRPGLDELSMSNWYPGNEWWIARTKAGRGVGLLNLVLDDLWTKRSLPFDVAIAEPAFQGKGLLNELVRLSFFRVFEGLAAESLWANVSVSNTRICRGYRSNFFRTIRRYADPAGGEELEHIRIDAEEYRARRSRGQIDVPVEETQSSAHF
jgi:RimJ/RimL family protein N-acetyltransferase